MPLSRIQNFKFKIQDWGKLILNVELENGMVGVEL